MHIATDPWTDVFNDIGGDAAPEIGWTYFVAALECGSVDIVHIRYKSTSK